MTDAANLGLSRGTTAPIRSRIAIEAGEIACLRWPGPEKPPLLFCHANGFCASAYRRLLAPVAGAFDIYAIDLRGHGRTRLPVRPIDLKSWHVYAADIGAALDRLSGEVAGPWRLAGHSFGGVAAAMAARGRRDVEALALIEPVAPPSIFSAFAATPVWPLFSRHMSLVKGARARRSQWPDRRSALEGYARKRLFASWAEGCLADYLEDGLVESEDGVVLACAPEWEAATFAAQANDVWGALLSAPAPVRVLAADRQSTVSGYALRRLSRLGIRVERMSGVSHLLTMERPEMAAEFLTALAPDSRRAWSG